MGCSVVTRPSGPRSDAWLSLVLALVPAVVAAESPLRFDRDIRPLLSENCYACHGPGQQEAGLRLDSAEQAMRELESGARAIVAGDPAASELLARINAADPDILMPPPHSKKTLTPEQKALLTRWIQAGAPYEKHWSFRPLERPSLPPANHRPHPIDRFLDADLAAAGLPVNGEADRATLIRRLSFALTGLPPAPEEVAAFVGDTSPAAYENLVDRLLASPHHGEEMARHWLDNARYADTHGLHLDNEREMWLYRDWVVKAFNENLPFDQFTIWQVAGDLLPDAAADQQIATGFCRANVTTSEGGSINEELLFRYAVDRAATLTNAWLGLTGQCAVCHDHKFDPISQREFYSLYAFFNSAADPGFDGNTRRTAPALPVATPEQADALAAVDRELAPAERALDEAIAAAGYVDPADESDGEEGRATLWLADGWPAGAVVRPSPGGTATWIESTSAAPAQAGSRSLDVVATGPVQVVATAGEETFAIPDKGQLFVHVWLDPAAPPGAVMLQLRTRSWKHGVVWGDWAHVPFTDSRKTDHGGLVHAGPLPAAGSWARLAIDPARLDLKPGAEVTAVSLAQGDGHARWDSIGVSLPAAAAQDPARSFLAWWKVKSTLTVSDLRDVPTELRPLVQQGPDKTTDPTDIARLKRHWFTQVWASPSEKIVTAFATYDALRKIRDGIDDLVPRSLVFNDLPQMRESFVMLRGAYDKPGDKVNRNTPAFLPPLAVPDEQTPSRLDLAKWLVSREHPLTPRVAANRLWQQFFGTGLVKTHEDFGLQGEPPSHPELLDWLAAEYRDGWDTRKIVRLIVTSGAFRRSGVVQPLQLARDPENRLLARGPRTRLDAEQIRDQALFVSGLLVPTMGGRGVKPYQPDNIWEPLAYANSNTKNYHRDSGDKLYRRSLYTFLKRTAPPPFMSNFDAPNREAFCGRRERSNTPLQALQLMNDEQHVEAARALAARMLAASVVDDPGRIDWLFRTVLARPPEPAEREVVAKAAAQHRERYAADPAAAGKLIRIGDSEPPAHIEPAELAAWTLVANTLLNLDETLTRN